MPTIKLTGLSALGQVTRLGDTDDAQLEGGLIVGNADTDSIVINAEFDSDLIPDDDATYDLGSETKRWNNIAAVTYYGDGSNLDGLGPGGNDNQVQYNSGGILEGTGQLYYKGGKVGIGDFENETPTSLLHIKGNFGGGQTHGTVSIEDYAFPPTIYFNRSNGDNQNTTGVSNGDTLGALYFKGYNSSSNSVQAGAQIRAIVDGTPSNTTSDMPTSLRLETTSDGQSTTSTRMIIKPSGLVGINNLTPTYQLDVDGAGIRTTNSAGAIISLGLDYLNPFSGVLLGQLRFGGVTQAQSSVNIEAYTDGNWSTAFGSYLTLNTTQNGSTTPSETMRVSQSAITLKAPTTIESIATVESTLYVEGESGVVVRNGSGQVAVQSTITSLESKMTLSTVETANVLANQVSVNTDMNASVPANCALIGYYTGSDAIAINSGGNSVNGFIIYDQNNQTPLSINDNGRTYVGTLSPFGAEYSNWTYPMDLSNTGNGAYFEGNNSSGPAFMFANRSTDTSSDGIGILIGKGMYNDNQGLFDEPTTSNTYIIFYAKKKSWGNANGDPDENPEPIGAIRGDGTGGISIDYSFTGKHATVMVLDEGVVVGMIVESTGDIWHTSKEGVSTALPKVSLSNSSKSKKVYGVVATLSGNFNGYVLSSPPLENETHIEVNSIGEGRVWVTNMGGDIENGDYITSSQISGYGMFQDDDLLHNYTVAKCTENINWESISETIEHNGQTYKKYLSACTYHCG